MVATRASTLGGSLPSAKRKITHDQDESSDGISDKKTAKKVKKGGTHVNTSGSSVKPVAKKKQSRLDSLIIGPGSKGRCRAHKATNSRKSRLRKSDLGKLAQIMKLPVEIFCTIASHLRPEDLLKLSQANRSLNNLLLSKFSRPIWIACESAVWMPPCPSDLNELRYASLYFRKSCDACGCSGVESVIHPLRVRLCKRCIKVNVVRGDGLATQAFGEHVSGLCEIYTLLPWSEMDETEYPFLRVKNSSVKYRHFLKPDFLEVVGAYLETEPGSEERKLFVEKRHRLVAEVAKHIEEMVAWQISQSRARWEAEEAIRWARRRQVANRLHSLGYSYEAIGSMTSMPDDDKHTRESWLRLVCQPRELTDRSILENIQPKLERLVAQKRQFDHEQAINKKRRWRETELLNLYKEYLCQHWSFRMTQVPLGLTDLCEIPEVSDLIEENECSVVIDGERWKPMEDKLPQFLEHHIKRVKHHCASLLLLAKQNPQETAQVAFSTWKSADVTGTEADIDTSVISRATAFFQWPPEPCGPFTFRQMAAIRHYHELSNDYPSWESLRLQVEGPTFQAANALLLSMGFGEETSMDYMESQGRSFVCLQCDPTLQKRMTWKELVIHVSSEVRACKKSHGRLLKIHKIEPGDTPLALLDLAAPNHPLHR